MESKEQTKLNRNRLIGTGNKLIVAGRENDVFANEVLSSEFWEVWA